MRKMIIFTDINAVEICCRRRDSRQLFPIHVIVHTGTYKFCLCDINARHICMNIGCRLSMTFLYRFNL